MNGLPDPTLDQLWQIYEFIGQLEGQDLDWLLSQLPGWDATIMFWTRNESAAEDLIKTIAMTINGGLNGAFNVHARERSF